jgi:DNA-binding MarR family transcriptional regulator
VSCNYTWDTGFDMVNSVGNEVSTGRAEALARVAEAFTTFSSRPSLARMRERFAAEVGAGIDPSSYPMLTRIDSWGPVRTSDLAERIGLDISTVSRKTADLEEAGLVVRAPDPHDGRAHLLEVTREGNRVVVRMREARNALLDRALADWSVAEIRRLADALTRFTTALAEVL